MVPASEYSHCNIIWLNYNIICLKYVPQNDVGNHIEACISAIWDHGMCPRTAEAQDDGGESQGPNCPGPQRPRAVLFELQRTSGPGTGAGVITQEYMCI